MQSGEGQLFDAPFRGSIHLQHALYEVRGLAAETGRGDVTVRGISLESLPTWMFNLQHISQSDTILLPMTHFNV